MFEEYEWKFFFLNQLFQKNFELNFGSRVVPLFSFVYFFNIWVWSVIIKWIINNLIGLIVDKSCMLEWGSVQIGTCCRDIRGFLGCINLIHLICFFSRGHLLMPFDFWTTFLSLNSEKSGWLSAFFNLYQCCLVINSRPHLLSRLL